MKDENKGMASPFGNSDKRPRKTAEESLKGTEVRAEVIARLKKAGDNDQCFVVIKDSDDVPNGSMCGMVHGNPVELAMAISKVLLDQPALCALVVSMVMTSINEITEGK